MVLETKRLLLQPLSMAHTEDFHELMSNPACMDGGWKPSLSRQESGEMLKLYMETGDRLAIVLKENHKGIGFIRICPDNNRGRLSAKMINYLLNERYWNNGYMTEAVRRAVGYAFDKWDLDLLSAFTTPQNIRSRSVLEKSGFRYETTIKNGFTRYDGEIFDSVIYSIARPEA